MATKAILALADGSFYEGYSFGAATDAFGEVVFNTSMAGYQEMLTDPSYAGQIVLPTYPLIGNYGTNPQDVESARIQVRGFVVREECGQPSHFRKSQTLQQYLLDSGIPGIYGVDTRAITRKLRSAGVMMGMITTRGHSEALSELRKQPDYGSVDFVRLVSTTFKYEWEGPADDGRHYRVVALDCGLKYNILRILRSKGCAVTVVPCTASAEDILELKPDGILLSPGPGDPELLDYAARTIRQLAGVKPIMGICLGSQLIAKAFGGKTFKLKFGHRGANHPVRDLSDGRVHITSQNHGYAVDLTSLPDELEVTHVNLNDNTIEGVRHRRLPIFSVQYHSEASPGPLDNMYLFDKFIKLMEGR